MRLYSNRSVLSWPIDKIYPPFTGSGKSVIDFIFDDQRFNVIELLKKCDTCAKTLEEFNIIKVGLELYIEQAWVFNNSKYEVIRCDCPSLEVRFIHSNQHIGVSFYCIY